jgi:drug/metabolite transporter, DME family
MPAELLALLAACCYASAHVAVKFGTEEVPILVGLLITQATGVLVLAAFAVTTVHSWDVPVVSVVVFALAGVVGPGLGRALGMRSVRDAGTTVAIPVQASATPVLSTIAGAFLFREVVSVGDALALVLIVTGIWFCVKGGSTNRHTAAYLLDIAKPRVRPYAVVVVPLISGAAYSMSDVARKSALSVHGDAVLGALIGLTAAFTVWLAIFLMTPRYRPVPRLSRASIWFCVSGIFSAGAQVTLMSALKVGDLSTVAPIAASNPIIVIILSAILLRKLEHLRRETIAGAAIASLGVAYLSLG